MAKTKCENIEHLQRVHDRKNLHKQVRELNKKTYGPKRNL